MQTLHSLPEPVADVAAEGRLDDIPGFGEAIRAKITDILRTGTTPLYERVKDQVPAGVLGLLGLPGLGAKTARQVWQGLGVESVEALEEAARSGKLATLPGMGEKTVQKILASIERARRYGDRILLSQALPLAESLVAQLRPRAEVEHLDYAGSLRRGLETIGDIDLVGASRDPAATIAAFVHLPQVGRVITQGERMARVALHGGVEVDLKLVRPGDYGPLLHHFTGSRAHSIHLRKIAEARGLKINEYGVFRGDTELPLGDDEDAVYQVLGLPPIPIHLREDRGEIEAAQAGTLPHLITEADIRGDVHAHTTASDGTATIEQMAQAAQARGYEYMAITDHSQSLRIAGGLTPERLRGQIREIRRLEDALGIACFAGSEVDIRADGTLDFEDALLAELDFVIASAHLHNNQGEAAQTKRLIGAIENPHVDLIAHPTGRLLGKRDPYPLDFDAVCEAARRTGTALEINSSPDRLDLSDAYARHACQQGVRLMVNTDAHAPDNYGLLRYGITVARRAWLTAEDVLNTRPLAAFRDWLGR
ncbi:MAG: DNA polymerase/3'-5' exonuclease PolX [Armatimonadetes bacterium]|nr:DNA polymerase/3'-5' exonuclease PolX [Armatimonadota bacterium]